MTLHSPLRVHQVEDAHDASSSTSSSQPAHGPQVASVCRKLQISEQTFYRWKKKFGGLGVVEVRRLKQLEDEVRRLKPLVADLSLDKTMLQDAMGKRL